MSHGEDLERRTRDRAYQLWIEDGQPIGKEKEHWERARTEVEGQSDKPVVVPPSGTSFGP